MRLVPIQRVAASYHSENSIIPRSPVQQPFAKQSNRCSCCGFCSQLTHKPFFHKQQSIGKPFGRIFNTRSFSCPCSKKLAAIYQMEEGLEYRLKQYVTAADSFADFIKLLKTKRYTQTRLQRLGLLCIVPSDKS